MNRQKSIGVFENTKKEEIYIFQGEGSQYLFSNITGAILEFNDYLKAFLQKPSKDTNKELYDYIFNADIIENFLHQKYESLSNLTINTLSLFLTNKCNLNCKYCFEKDASNTDKAILTLSTLEEALRFLVTNFTYNKVFNISFFGGEPLLRFKFIKESIPLFKEFEKSHNIIFNYSVTTNGTILSKNILDFLQDNRFHLVISIDGSKQNHNINRPFKDGKGSYDQITNNAKQMVKKLPSIARVTITNPKTNLVNICEELSGIGFKAVAFAFEIKEHTYSEKDFEEITNSIIKLRNYYKKRIKEGTDFLIHNFLKTICFFYAGYRLYSACLPCNAGLDYFSLFPDGNIYLCHGLNNINEYKFGDISSEFDKDKRLHFLQNNWILNKNKTCSKCWAKHLCGGLCYAQEYFQKNNGNLSIYCNFNKEFIKASLYIYTSLTDEQRNSTNSFFTDQSFKVMNNLF